MAQIMSHPRFPECDGWLYWDRGAVVVKNPDETLLAMMCEIAEKLSARVQGEEGEYYQSDGTIQDPDRPHLRWREEPTP